MPRDMVRRQTVFLVLRTYVNRVVIGLANPDASFRIPVYAEILSEGDRSRDLYVVADGSVEVLSPFRKVDESPVVLAVVKRFEYFGAAR
jgi:hypothetical protein